MGAIELFNATFLDVEGGRAFEPGVSVVIEDGLVSAMPGLSDQPGKISVERRIDLGGRWVSPAFCNTHSHIRMLIPSAVAGLCDIRRAHRLADRQIEQTMKRCLARGITLLRDALSDDLRQNGGLSDRISGGQLPGPRIHQCVLVSPLGASFAPPRSFGEGLLYRLIGLPYPAYESEISGTVVFPPDAEPDAVRDAVNRAIDERGADAIKLYQQAEKKISYKPGAVLMSQPQLDAAADQARKRGKPITMHHVSARSLREGVRAGVTSLAHLAIDEALSDDDVAAFIDAGCILEPTVTMAFDLCFPLPGDAHAEHPRMRRVAEIREARLAEQVEAWLPELRPAVLRGVEKIRANRLKLFGIKDMSGIFRFFSSIIGVGVDNLRRLAAAGAPMACANDAGAVPRKQSEIGLEIELMREFLGEDPAVAWSAADALRFATLHGARSMGLEHGFGTIEVGKVADLAVLEGDPLADPTLIGRPVAALFMNGELVVDEVGLG